MTEANRRTNLQAEWRAGERAWQQGEVLLEAGHPDGALNRYYYSAFHAAAAALLAEGVEAVTHNGVRSQLHMHFVKSGRLSLTLASKLTALQKQREDADYDSSVEFDADQARWAREAAAELREALESWLRSQGWLPVPDR